MITGQWGDTINNTALGRLVSRTYTYVVPTAYNNINCLVEDCHIAVFVAESQQKIYSGDVVYAVGGTNKYIGQITAPTEIIKAGTAATPVNFNTTAESALQNLSDFEFTLTSTNLPSDWQAGFEIDMNLYTSTATVAIDPANPKPVNITVIPGTTPALPSFRLSMKSVNDPMAPAKMMDVHVIANVTDLVINGSGGAETATFDSLYINGLALAGNIHHTSTTARLLGPAMASNAFIDVNNLYLNIGWTFPALKDDEATAVMAFMDNGGNVMIAGQDIGWDIMSGAAGSNGNAITQNFYTNYLHTGYVGDGAAANNQLTPVGGDVVFGSIGSSNIIDPYAGNMYPEELSALAGAFPIFKYNNGTKVAATRSETPVYKTVYFGVGMEMLGNKAVKNAIVKTSHDWFYGLVSVPEVQNTTGMNVYPNPAKSTAILAIPSANVNQELRISDITGRVIQINTIPAQSTHYEINTTSFENGYYLIQLSGNPQVLKLEILK